MRTRLLIASAWLVVMVAGIGAQQDARAVLQAVAKNIGADTITTLQITGT